MTDHRLILTTELTLAAGLACLALAMPSATLAAEVYTPPQGCKLEMTVQNRGCVVSQHYRCDADKPGDQWVTYFHKEGQVYTSRIDRETRWMESEDLTSGIRDELVEGGPDDPSLTTLLAEGRDDFDFWTVSNTGERLHHVGFDVLTGETAQVDGVPLRRTQFHLKTFDENGELLIERQGRQFVSDEHRRFYGGVETNSDWTGKAEKVDDSPIEFAFPGQPGFGSTQPQYDCEVQMVRLEPGLAP